MTNPVAETLSAGASATAFPLRHRRYALTLLMIIYALNFLDRQVVTILAEPIKRSLHLADWQIGAVNGLAFAILYTGLGLPMARLADRADRAWLISGSLTVWSVFTAACGLVSGFPQLLLARLGVGIGEAGCTPAAHSLITEVTPRPKLASALAFYALGIPLGSLIGLTMGGMIADAFGWRTAFFVAGAPGVLVAGLALFTLRDPRRVLDARTSDAAPVSLAAALRELGGKPAFWWISLAAGFAAFVYYSQAAFYGSLFMRAHSLEIAQLGRRFGLGAAGFLGVALGLILGVSSGLGTYIGGQIADRAAKSGISGYTRVPQFALITCAPFFVALDLSKSGVVALICMVPAIFAQSLIYGSTFASAQALASPRVRATAAAILLFLTNSIGLGVGPLAVGALSDHLASAAGSARGLQLALAWSCILLIVSAICFALAGRTIGRDEYLPA